MPPHNNLRHKTEQTTAMGNNTDEFQKHYTK